MSHTKLIADIKQGQFAPVYLLMGEEPFFIDQIANAIEAHAIPEDMQGFNQHILYGLDTKVDQLIGVAKSFPMMGERQLVLVREAQSLDKIQNLAGYCKQPTPTTVLVLCHKYKKVDKRSELYKAVNETGAVFTSDKVRDYKVADWIAQRSKDLGLQLPPKLCSLLSEYLGNNLARIDNELTKLKQIAGDQPVTDDLIQEHVGISKTYNIYELQKAVLNRNFAKTLQITDHYAKNPKEFHIVPAISSLYNVLTRCIKLYYSKDKSQQGASKVGVSFFFYKDYMQALQNYKLKELVQKIRVLKEYDLKAKGLGSSGADSEGLFVEMMQKIILH